MKRWLCIFVAVLLLFILAGGKWLAPRRAKPLFDASAKAEGIRPQQISASQKQTAPSAANQKADVSQNKNAQTAVSRRQGGEAFRVTLLSAVPGRTRFRFELGEYTVEEESVDGKTYSRVQLDGAWPSMVKGRPALPVIRRDFVVAKGRKAHFRVIDVQEDTVACAPPKPSVGEQPKTAEIPPVEEDASVYGGDGVYPAEAVAADERYVIRGAEGMSVSIHPMRYDFHDGIMVVTRSFEAEITEDDAEAEDYAMRDDEWNFRCLLASRFKNANLLRGGEAGGVIGTLLFIVPDAWAYRLAPFAIWKERLGNAVIVAGYPSAMGEGVDALADYIRNAYYDSLVSHVVIFGDRGNIPPYEISKKPESPGTYMPTTDTPYAWVDGDDLYADLFISRMAVSTGAELTAVCGKIMAYEQSTDDGVWRGTGVFIGSDEIGTSGISEGVRDAEFLEMERPKLLEGNAIEVVDAQTGFLLGTVTNDSQVSDDIFYTPITTHEVVLVPAGREINFRWVLGDSPNYCSWTVYDVNGDEIFSGAGNDNMNTGTILYTYTVDCLINPYKMPTELTCTKVSATTATLSWTEKASATA